MRKARPVSPLFEGLHDDGADEPEARLLVGEVACGESRPPRWIEGLIRPWELARIAYFTSKRQVIPAQGRFK